MLVMFAVFLLNCSCSVDCRLCFMFCIRCRFHFLLFVVFVFLLFYVGVGFWLRACHICFFRLFFCSGFGCVLVMFAVFLLNCSCSVDCYVVAFVLFFVLGRDVVVVVCIFVFLLSYVGVGWWFDRLHLISSK